MTKIRKKTSGYTLLELMITLAIVISSVALAAPAIGAAMKERRKTSLQYAVIQHLRDARASAIGYGYAYRILYDGADNGGRGTMTFERGTTNKCSSSTFAQVASKPIFSTDEYESSETLSIWLQAPTITTIQLCYQPTGVMYWRQDPLDRWVSEVAGGGIVFWIRETPPAIGEIIRHIVAPLSGNPRPIL